jgi:hypothetical protein
MRDEAIPRPFSNVVRRMQADRRAPRFSNGPGGPLIVWHDDVRRRTVKDEIVIGLSADELKAAGGTDAGAVAHALAQKGDMTVWQYNVHRGANGEM